MKERSKEYHSGWHRQSLVFLTRSTVSPPGSSTTTTTMGMRYIRIRLPDVERSAANIFMANLRLLEDPGQNNAPQGYTVTWRWNFHQRITHEAGLTEPLSTMGCNLAIWITTVIWTSMQPPGDLQLYLHCSNKMYRNVQRWIFWGCYLQRRFGHITSKPGHAVGFADLERGTGDRDIMLF